MRIQKRHGATLATAALLLTLPTAAHATVMTAKPAGAFRDSVGVNTHFNFYDRAYFLTSEPVQVNYAKAATPPVLTKAYDDPAVQQALPFSDTLLKAIEQGRSRPVSPVYPQISEAISDNVYAALSGDTSVDAAVKQMQSDIEKALQTF